MTEQEKKDTLAALDKLIAGEAVKPWHSVLVWPVDEKQGGMQIYFETALDAHDALHKSGHASDSKFCLPLPATRRNELDNIIVGNNGRPYIRSKDGALVPLECAVGYRS